MNLPYTPWRYLLGFSAGNRKRYEGGSRSLRKVLRGFGGLGFQGQLATGTVTSATVRKLTIRGLPPKPWQEDATVVVIKEITTVIAVARITEV